MPANASLSPSNAPQPTELGIHTISPEQAEKMAEFFSQLGDPNRLRILSLLAQSEANVGDIATTLGMTQSAVSHQLRILKASRLVTFRRVGRHKFYSLHDHHIVSLYTTVTEHLAEPEH